MKKFELEVCVDSVESAMAAKSGGATRLEVCDNLVIGGTTPSTWLYEEIRKNCDMRMHILIRPRYGDFYYTEYEFSIMRNAIRWYREHGAEGIVIGMLKTDGSLDIERMSILMKEAKGMSVTLHRAFDVCRDPYETMEDAIRLGINTILTSGQANVSTNGTAVLQKLVEKSHGRIDIMVGSGIHYQIIKDLYEKTGASAYHMSGKKMLDSPMDYRKPNVSMGLPSITEYVIERTDSENIRKAREVLDELMRYSVCSF